MMKKINQKSNFLLIDDLKSLINNKDFYEETKNGVQIHPNYSNKLNHYHKVTIISLSLPKLRKTLSKNRLLSEFNRVLLLDQDMVETLFQNAINGYCIESYDLMQFNWKQSVKGVWFWYNIFQRFVTDNDIS